MVKQFNTGYFNSIKSNALRRYCLWLLGTPGYGYTMFSGMEKALQSGDDDSLAEWEEAYPEETGLFKKHIEKSPETTEIQKQLFNINQ